MTENDLATGITWLGTTYRSLLGPSETGGKMSILDSVSPAGSGPPRHIHHAEDEVFVLLSGECEFWLEGETLTAGAGESVFIPKGAEHTFRVISAHPCRHLIILTPGGFEGFFSDMARGGFRIPDDMAAIEQSGARHNLTFTGPPL